MFKVTMKGGSTYETTNLLANGENLHIERPAPGGQTIVSGANVVSIEWQRPEKPGKAVSTIAQTAIGT